MNRSVKVLGFAGSLRKNSYNKALVYFAKELMPEGSSLEIFDLEGIPPFNQDFEYQMPERVRELKEKIRVADAILMSTPEYNHSVSGVLKNAIDWASRPYGDNVFKGKPVAVMSASTGFIGGARAQEDLKKILLYLDAHIVDKPEVIVGIAHQKFDQNGVLKDENAKKFMKELLENLVAAARK